MEKLIRVITLDDIYNLNVELEKGYTIVATYAAYDGNKNGIVTGHDYLIKKDDK